MRLLPLVALLLTLAACSTAREPIPIPAVEDFVVVNELEANERIRTRDRDGWRYLNDRYVVYWTRRKNYLLEFRRECKYLRENAEKVPDLRIDQGSLRARIDTIRGCVVSHIYTITPDQKIELYTLGDAPGA